jgi:hypothetical protein
VEDSADQPDMDDAEDGAVQSGPVMNDRQLNSLRGRADDGRNVDHLVGQDPEVLVRTLLTLMAFAMRPSKYTSWKN